MGVVSFPVQKLVDGEVFDGWFDVLDLVSKPVKGCSIRATLSFRQAAAAASTYEAAFCIPLPLRTLDPAYPAYPNTERSCGYECSASTTLGIQQSGFLACVPASWLSVAEKKTVLS